MLAGIELRLLQKNQLYQLPQLISGYKSSEKYAISKTETDQETTFTLKLVPLATPRTFTYDHLDETELTRLAAIVDNGLSWGAFQGAELVGAAICSVESWNNSLRVWEFHVAEAWRGQGIGRRLMEKVIETAVRQKFRVIICETQSSNVPAIRFYRKLGFVLDSLDLSFYSSEDLQQESVAIFMKRYLL